MGHISPACHVMPSCIVSSVALIRDAGRFTMVAIAQSVEHLIVVQEVARSSRVSHPTSPPYSRLGNRDFSNPKNTIGINLCDPYVTQTWQNEVNSSPRVCARFLRRSSQRHHI